MNIISTPSFKIAANLSGDEQAKRIALLLPGRLDTKDYVNFTSHAEVLAGLGYYVAAIDAPGTWDSPGNIRDYTTSQYVKAVKELIEHFENRPTLLLGHSRGGAVAMIASQHPSVEAVAVVNAAYNAPSAPDPAKIVEGGLEESRDIPPGATRTAEQRLFHLPLAYFSDGNQYVPREYLQKFGGPKLIAHAVHDEFADYKDIEALAQELSEPKMFVRLENAHDYRCFPDDMERVNRALAEFVTMYIS